MMPYDPNVDLASELGTEEKILQLQALRPPSPGSQWYEIMSNSIGQWEAQQRLKQIQAQREAQRKKEEDQLRALQGLGDRATPMDFMSYGPTRQKAGEAALTAARDRTNFAGLKEAMSSLMGSGAAPGGQGQMSDEAAIRQKLILMEQSDNPRIAAWAKAQLADMNKGYDPEHLYGGGPSGRAPALLPGALGAIEAKTYGRERAKAAMDPVQATFPGALPGQTKTMSKFEQITGNPYGSPQGMGGPTPTAPAQTGFGAAPQGAGPGSPPPTGAGTGAGQWYVDPSGQRHFVPQSVVDASKSGADFNMSFAPQQSPGGQVISDPIKTKMAEEAATSGRKILDKMLESAPNVQSEIQNLDELMNLNNTGQVIGGPFASAQLALRRAQAQLSGNPDADVAITEVYLKQVLTQLKDQLKAFGSGTGISNLDLLTAERLLAIPDLTQVGRDGVLRLMKRAAVSQLMNTQDASMHLQMYRSLDNWSPKSYNEKGEVMTKEDIKKDPLYKMAEKGVLRNNEGSFIGDLSRSAGEFLGNPVNVLRGMEQSMSGNDQGPLDPNEPGVAQGRVLPQALMAASVAVPAGRALGGAIAAAKGVPGWLLGAAGRAWRGTAAETRAAAAAESRAAGQYMKFRPNQRPYNYRQGE